MRSTQSNLARRGSSGIYYPPSCRFDGGREQSMEPSRNHRPVIFPNPKGGLCASLSAWLPDLEFSERPKESVFQITARMEGEDKSVLFGFHRFDPEINCQGLCDTYNINHRLNVIMRAGQDVKRGLQVPAAASCLKIWSQEIQC